MAKISKKLYLRGFKFFLILYEAYLAHHRISSMWYDLSMIEKYKEFHTTFELGPKTLVRPSMSYTLCVYCTLQVLCLYKSNANIFIACLGGVLIQ
jgi:hypothetical protein